MGIESLPFQFNIYALPLTVIALLTPLMGFYIYLQNKRSSVNLSFFLLCLSVTPWLLGQFGVYSARDPKVALWIYRYVAFLGVVFISPLVYLFSTLWLNLYDKKKQWVRLGFAGSLFFYGLGTVSDKSFPGVTRYFWGFYPVYGVYNYLFLIFFFSYFLASFYNFVQAYRRETHGIRRAQIRLITLAFFLSFFSSLDFLPKLIYFNFYPPGFLCVFFCLIVVAYTIIRYKLLDIETVIHKTLMWFGSTVVAVVPFALLIYLSWPWAGRLSGVYATAYYLVVMILFYAYFRTVQPVLSHFFRRKRANLQAVVTAFAEELVHLKNLRDLLQRFTRLLRRTLYTRHLSIYLRHEKDNQFVPAIAKGMRGLNPLEAGHPFLVWLEKEDRIVVEDLAQGDPALVPLKDQMRQYFSETQALVAVPFVLGGKLIGVLHLGKKENLRKYSAAEIDFLAQLKSPITIAFSNSLQFENVSRLYQQVQIQNERLKELDRLKSEFLANTSHELRTPLHGILGLVESILDGADGPVNDIQRKHLRMIVESGTNLKELINNLLELSRLEAGQLRLNIKPFNVLNVVDAVLALLEGVAQKKNIHLERIGSSEIPDAYGDPEKIQRVLINLVGNAIKFTEKGSVTVRVAEGEGHVQISVKDTGIGIAPEDQKIIFDRFRQVDGTTTRRFEGTGLGLSIAQEIVRLHGGEIEVESELGQGSTFRFSLPKQPPAVVGQEDASVTKVQGEKATPSQVFLPQEDQQEEVYGADKEYTLERDEEYVQAVRGNGEKILIIDDNPVNREVVKTRLVMNNYEVLEAQDGIEGLEKMDQETPDLVILDLMMPRMSGYEFCKRLRQAHPPDELPLIMLTAKTAMGDKVYGLHLGANDYIAKPFNKEELIARVGILLKIRKMTQELRKWNAELEKRVDERTRELIKTQEQLIQAEKLATLGTLAGGVAHEINNPLTAVLANAQMLKMASKPEDMEAISLIEEGAKRCQVIIQKLMKYSRRSEEKQKDQLLDLGRVIKNVAAMLEYQLKQENIQLVLELDPLPPMVGHANELEQVFTNLIVNSRDAIKEAHRQEGKVKIAATSGDGWIDVRVQDNGIGIEKDHLNKIFDPFFTTKEVGMGTGLGLAVTYSILEKHGCKVDVDSERGHGTTFTLRFKVPSENQNPEGDASQPMPSSGSFPVSEKSERCQHL